MSGELEDALAVVDTRIAWVLDHAGMSQWLKLALRGALQCDAITVGNEVEVLRHLLQSRADAWAGGCVEPVGKSASVLSRNKVRCDARPSLPI